MVAADHLQVPRQHGLFHHHGIDLGDGTVAHYLEAREILRSPIQNFCQGQAISVIKHENPSSTGTTLRRAMSRIGEQNYNLLFNNCEHFANWCKTGLHRSRQMEDWLKPSSIGAIAFGQLIPKAVIAGLNLILQQGLTDERSKKAAERLLIILEKIHLNVLSKLESVLDKANTSFEKYPTKISLESNNSLTNTLLLQGQKLADDLTTLENLNERIGDLINQSDSKV